LQLFIDTLTYAGAVLLSALGFRLVYITGRFFHFAHAATIPAGAYCAWWLMGAGLPVVLAGIFSVFAVGIAGSVLFLALLAPMKARGAGPQMLLLASLALYLLAQHALAIGFGDDARALMAGTGPVWSLGGAQSTGIQLLLICASLVTVLLMWFMEARSRVGTRLVAVAEHQELSRVFGIHVVRVQAVAFAVGSGIGGLLGVFVAADQSFSPDMGFQWLLPGVVAVLVGGVWSIPFVALAALLIAVLRVSAIWFLGGAWQNVFVYVLLFIYFIAHPSTLASVTRRS